MFKAKFWWGLRGGGRKTDFLIKIVKWDKVVHAQICNSQQDWCEGQGMKRVSIYMVINGCLPSTYHAKVLSLRWGLDAQTRVAKLHDLKHKLVESFTYPRSVQRRGSRDDIQNFNRKSKHTKSSSKFGPIARQELSLFILPSLILSIVQPNLCGMLEFCRHRECMYRGQGASMEGLQIYPPYNTQLGKEAD